MFHKLRPLQEWNELPRDCNGDPINFSDPTGLAGTPSLAEINKLKGAVGTPGGLENYTSYLSQFAPAPKSAPTSAGTFMKGVTSDSNTACFSIGSGSADDISTSNDSAAIYWAMLYYNPALACDREFGSNFYLYTAPDGTVYLTYTVPAMGGMTSVNASAPPGGQTVIGNIHSHPGLGNTEPSLPGDNDGLRKIGTNVIGYLCAPNGKLLKYTGDSRQPATLLYSPIPGFGCGISVADFSDWWASHGGLPTNAGWFVTAANQAFMDGKILNETWFIGETGISSRSNVYNWPNDKNPTANIFHPFSASR